MSEKDVEDFIKATAQKYPSFTPAQFRQEFEAILDRKPTLPEVTMFIRASKSGGETEKSTDQVSVVQKIAGPYVLGECLGKGPFCEVFIGTRDKNKYAIKRINDKHIADFEKEFASHITVTLNSKFIVKYYEAFNGAEGDVFVVMELCGKGDLRLVLNKIKELGGNLNPPLISKILTQLLLGLGVIHSHHILHRDLKPENIFVGDDDDFKIGDFACAKKLDSTDQRANTVIGTPLYESPEVLRGEEYDSSADMWSLGVLLYELCVGERPFEHTNRYKLEELIRAGKFRPIPRTRAPDDLIDIIYSLLSVNPKQRPSAAALLRHSFIQKVAKETNLLQYFPPL